MSLDINPVVPQGRKLIQSYGEGRFRISGEDIDGSVFVFSESTHPWLIDDSAGITIASLQAVTDARADIDIVLIGCGAMFTAVPKGLRAALKEYGIALEWMDTGAACRTFNVLVAEERRVCAALLAVD